MMRAPPRAPTEGVRGFCAGTVHFLRGVSCGVSSHEPARNRTGKKSGAVLTALSDGLFGERSRHAGITFDCLRKAYGTGTEPLVRVTPTARQLMSREPKHLS
ncbi:hypothetical protein GCM10022403_011150 [Streptomyces coacervatus]|uniref:Uncharacterized protein n=1 Tax=Streptomyces coacervatus TaxID=647381 RepID=A0ABP7H034_9ACTN